MSNFFDGAQQKRLIPPDILEKDDLESYEAVAEVCMTSFAYCFGVPNTVPYWFGKSYRSARCRLFTNNVGNYVCFGDLVKLLLKDDSIYESWCEEYWEDCSFDDRVDRVTEVFSAFRVPPSDTMSYLRLMTHLDGFAYNNDRHFGNFGLTVKNRIYSPAPIFDFGLSYFEPNSKSKFSANPFGLTLTEQAFRFGTERFKALHDPYKDIASRVSFRNPLKSAYLDRLSYYLDQGTAT